MYTSGSNINNGDYGYDYQWFFTHGDTLIAGKNYYQFCKSQIGVTYDMNNVVVSRDTSYRNYYVGALREDSSIIYIINSGSSSEQIWWNFNLALDSTIPFGQCPGQVTNVDSITFGSITRKMYSTNRSRPIYEGIGSINGPFSDPCIFVVGDGYWALNCYSIDGNNFYLPNADQTVPCEQPFNDVSTTAIELKNNIAVTLFPNPAIQSFQLQFSEPPYPETTFQFYNALGQLIKQEKITDLTTVINRGNLANGIYFWQVSANEKVLQRGKVIME